MRLEGVRFSRATRAVREIEQSRFEARVAAGSIVRSIHSRSPGLRDVGVGITRGEVRVHAAPTLLGLGVPIEVDGRPVLMIPDLPPPLEAADDRVVADTRVNGLRRTERAPFDQEAIAVVN